MWGWAFRQIRECRRRVGHTQDRGKIVLFFNSCIDILDRSLALCQCNWFLSLLLFLFLHSDWIWYACCIAHPDLSFSVFTCRCSSRRYTDSLTQQHSTCSRCTLLSSSIWCCKPQPSSSSTTSAPLSSRAWRLYSRSANSHHTKESFSQCKCDAVIVDRIQEMSQEMLNLSLFYLSLSPAVW